MPLQNRVTPFGEIVALSARGLLMGNRGGRLHDPETRLLTGRRWRSKAWIICSLHHKGRHREVMGTGYTELFFLDEVTALAAGHRPCFQCRRERARAFTAAWSTAHPQDLVANAAAMDATLHRERTPLGMRQHFLEPLPDLPDGAMIALPNAESDADDPSAIWQAWAVRGDRLLRWDGGGYPETRPRPDTGLAYALTPPSIIAVLAAGYRPMWHPSAE
ncbi:hypothetical protein [Amorphus orientalis]|uniref:Uncharacterized protein n=1 Tax=Amorphus orientalis TaxID=649198 RepID=A0AAE4ATT0_9HYPH|nr:hypothetical protein [Amorphus orientalis]MDQ0316530.1 hypothetical protein [Amorphus orientalis]